jgi:hypothetical protein
MPKLPMRHAKTKNMPQGQPRSDPRIHHGHDEDPPPTLPPVRALRPQQPVLFSINFNMPRRVASSMPVDGMHGDPW